MGLARQLHKRPPGQGNPLPRGVWAIVALVVVAQIAIFVGQLALQEDQRSTTDRALATAVRQFELAAGV